MLHPFLFAIFPVLFLFARNLDELSFGKTLPSMALALIFAGVLLLVFRFVFKVWNKSAVLSSVAVMLFFSYGHVYDVIYVLGEGENWISHRYLLLIWAAVFAFAAYKVWKTTSDLQKLNKSMNVMAAVLVLISVISLTTSSIERANFTKSLKEESQKTEEIKSLSGEKPDIYYFVLDAYASDWALKKFYNYDNSDFLNFLKKKGFFVAQKSLSNYPETRSSLPTMLNMNYLDKLGDSGKTSEVRKNYFLHEQLVKNHQVGKFLKSHGYSYIHFGSMWDITAANPYADRNIGRKSPSDFFSILYKSTALYPTSYLFGNFLNYFDLRLAQWERILYQFDELSKIPNAQSPKFVFAHIGIPHYPYVFNKDGSFNSFEREIPDEKFGHHPDDYLNQLIFLNVKMEKVIEDILAKSKKPPVIILQSDHGSRLFSLDKKVKSLEEISDDLLKDDFRNFSAYYLPDGNKGLYYQTATPVNTFRLLFNQYFGANFEILPDRSYITLPETDYKYLDITDRVAY